MPVIQPYEQQFLPQGQLNVEANAEQFGAGVGRAISNIGETFDNIAKDKAQVWALKTAGDTYDSLRQQFTEDRNKLDPNDPDFTLKLSNLTSNFNSQIDQKTSQVLSSAPSGYAGKAFEMQMLTNKKSLLSNAIANQAELAASYTAMQYEDRVRKDQNSLAENPTQDNFDRIVTNNDQFIGALSTIDPKTKMDWISTTRRKLAITAVGVLASTDPTFLSRVNAQGGKITSTGTIRGQVPGGGGGSFDSAVAFVLEKEGGYTASDGNSDAPANFGINQKANPDVDVKNLTKDNAIALYKQRYWNAIGADKMQPAMALVAFNAAVNMGVGAAKELLAKSDSDPAKFTELVKQRYAAIAANNPAQQKYLAGWLSRANDALAKATSEPTNILPQVQSLTEDQIASANPDVPGWQYLEWSDKMTAVRQAENVASGRLTTARSELTAALPDIEATLRAGEQYPGIDDGRFTLQNLQENFGEDQGKRYFDRVEYAKKVGGFVGQVKTLPVAKANEFIESLRPSGGEGYAAASITFNAAVEAYKQVQADRKLDYMNWAVSTPATNAKPLDVSSPDKFREGVVARIPVAIAGRMEYGVPNAGIFTKNEVQQLGDMLRGMNTRNQIDYLGALRDAAKGKEVWFYDAVRQLAPTNTSLAFAATMIPKSGTVETKAGAQNGDMVAQYILEGARILQGDDLGDKTKSAKPLNIDINKFRENFYDAVGPDAFRVPDAAVGAKMASDTMQAAMNYMASDMMRRGMVAFGPNDVGNAVKAVTGGTTTLNSRKVMLPWGMSEGDFNTKFDAAFKATMQASGLSGSNLDAPLAYEYVNVGDGKYLATFRGRPLVGKNGNFVVDVGTNRTTLPNVFGGLSFPDVGKEKIRDGR